MLTLPALAAIASGSFFGPTSIQRCRWPRVATHIAGDSRRHQHGYDRGDRIRRCGQPGQPATLTAFYGITSFSDSSIQVSNGGTLLATQLAVLDNVNVTLDAAGTIATSQWTTLTHSSLTVTAGSPSFAHLANIDGSTIAVSGGATVSLPAITNPLFAPADRQVAAGLGARAAR